MKKKNIFVILLLVLVSLVAATTYMKEEYNSKIEEERIEDAKKAVDKAVESKEEVDITDAKNIVATIETIDVKEELTLSIESLELEIRKDNIRNEYNSLLDLVQSNLSQEELNSVIEKINTIEYEDIKVELLERTTYIEGLVTKEKERLEQLAYYNKMQTIDATPVISTPPSNIEVIETLTGKITAFTPYCSDGCAGYTASGKFVGNGDIYQYDSEFGMVRIVAGDSSYPFGTIVRIKNLNYFGGDVYAIVLDRGGAIGKNRRALFDLLFATEENANRFGVASNIECEILRIGY